MDDEKERQIKVLAVFQSAESAEKVCWVAVCEGWEILVAPRIHTWPALPVLCIMDLSSKLFIAVRITACLSKLAIINCLQYSTLQQPIKCVVPRFRKHWFFFLMKILLAMIVGRHLINNTAVCRNLWIQTLQTTMWSLQYIKSTVGWAPAFLTDYLAANIEMYASVTTTCSVLYAVLYAAIVVLLLPAMPYTIKRHLYLG